MGPEKPPPLPEPLSARCSHTIVYPGLYWETLMWNGDRDVICQRTHDNQMDRETAFSLLVFSPTHLNLQLPLLLPIPEMYRELLSGQKSWPW